MQAIVVLQLALLSVHFKVSDLVSLGARWRGKGGGSREVEGFFLGKIQTPRLWLGGGGAPLIKLCVIRKTLSWVSSPPYLYAALGIPSHPGAEFLAFSKYWVVCSRVGGEISDQSHFTCLVYRARIFSAWVVLASL